MEKRQKKFIKGTLIAGALISVTALSATPNASSLFDYNVLGSGAEVRSEILQSETNHFNAFEATCGEKSETTEGKKTEAKCGEKKAEAKTDAKKSETKAATTATATTETTSAKKEATSETKAKEGKCGEGKCGDE